jgi:hypothetical protein
MRFSYLTLELFLMKWLFKKKIGWAWGGKGVWRGLVALEYLLTL